MRPSDMDAIARVVAQQVKEIVDKKLAGLPKPDPVDHSSEIAQLREMVEAQSNHIADLLNDNANLNDFGTKCLDMIQTLQDDLKALDGKETPQPDLSGFVKADDLEPLTTQIAAVETSIGEIIAADDHIVAAAQSIKESLPDDIKAAVETAFDETWKHEFAAMIPDSLDEDRIKSEIIKDMPEVNIDVDLIKGSVLDHLLKRLPDLIKNEMPEPAPAQAPTELQVIEAVKAMYPSIRHDLLQRIPTPSHKGLWDKDTKYDVGDEVVKNGSTFRLMEDTADAPPSPAWQLVSQGKLGKKGLPGEAGKKGEKGDDGVGVQDILYENGQFVFNLTNGETSVFDVDLPEQIANAVKKFMLDVRGDDDEPTS